ncbi:hypothetical protein GD416_00765 [Burkholderia sp. BE24]|uniref:hypothetical protein n=1 Tax=Burkholderia TaxID=32008 RepID=UPI00117CCB33|nr:MULTISPECIES: hypothetical protein [Burkholderia]MPV55022.1 hypothetical protein [Burkholderia sp. BE24]
MIAAPGQIRSFNKRRALAENRSPRFVLGNRSIFSGIATIETVKTIVEYSTVLTGNSRDKRMALPFGGALDDAGIATIVVAHDLDLRAGEPANADAGRTGVFGPAASAWYRPAIAIERRSQMESAHDLALH